nr:ATP-binding cassette domain-containing protein [uncultured Merdimonas sp.]
MEYVLTTENLTKRYRDFQALGGLSMHVEKGAIYGFVGRNGAGKTTLIRLICGLQKPTEGSYTLYGRNSERDDLRGVRRRMGAVVETPSIYGHLSAEDNLKEQYRVLGKPSFDGICELLDLVGLLETGKKKARHFSLGMKQRLGIAVALAGNPDFLVLDEPINGLDPQGIIEIRELILKLNRERKITFLISSHILDELSRIATHYGFIDGGRLMREISAKELEQSCRKCMHMEVSDIQALVRVLDQRALEYKVGTENSVDVFGSFEVTELILALEQEGCRVSSMVEKDESLESYYINLMGGESHA